MPPAGAPGLRGDEARKTVLLVFTHELRQRLELTDAQALGILPRVEALFEARLRGERQRRLLQARLLEAADDEATTDADLRALVAEALKHDEDAPARIHATLSQALEGLSPVQSARFLLLDHRAERELRDHARRTREGWSGGPRQPGGGGGMRPRGGMRPEGGGGMRPEGGGMRPDRGGAPRRF